MQHEKRIYLLIGAKGSGKSFLGQLLEQRLGIPFLRVEAIALRVRQERRFDDQSYVHEVFAAIERAVRAMLATEQAVVFESTGLTDAFDRMLLQLRQDFPVCLIRIVADAETCVWRVKHRDQHQHVSISDEHVREINRQVLAKQLPVSGAIDNTRASPEEILLAFQQITGKANKT